MAEKKPLEIALRKLNARMKTEKEIYDLLKSYEFNEEEIGETIVWLRENRYLDDRNYVREYFRARKLKGMATGRILRELSEKGISQSVAKETIEDYLYELEGPGNAGSFGNSEGLISVRDDEKILKPERETALEIGRKMAVSQLNSGKDCDEKFCARVGRKLMTMGYDSGTCYYVMGRIRNMKPEEL